MDALKQFEEVKSSFEEFLRKETDEWSFASPLGEAMKYSLFSGGKRYRPVLLLNAYKAFGGEIDEAVKLFAMAVETLHTYSLVHDDLPCMDNDDYRRGVPTCHKKFGETIATLAGDALLNLSYELIFRAIELSNNSPKYLKAATIFSSLTGANGLIGGQVKDLSFDESEGFDGLEFVYTRKTCNLIVASVVCGAILGGASETEWDAMRGFAYNFGFAFQIADDIIDGEKGDGCSILRLTDMDKAKVLLSEYSAKAMDYLNSLDRNLEFFKQFTLIAEKRVK